MIKICVTLNEGQGQYNKHVLHALVCLTMMTSTVSKESLANNYEKYNYATKTNKIAYHYCSACDRSCMMSRGICNEIVPCALH